MKTLTSTDQWLTRKTPREDVLSRKYRCRQWRRKGLRVRNETGNSLNFFYSCFMSFVFFLFPSSASAQKRHVIAKNVLRFFTRRQQMCNRSFIPLNSVKQFGRRVRCTQCQCHLNFYSSLDSIRWLFLTMNRLGHCTRTSLATANEQKQKIKTSTRRLPMYCNAHWS